MRRGRSVPACFPGEAGFALLRYVGRAASPRWTGPVTGVKYPFLQGEERYVDARDADAFLRIPGEWRAFDTGEGDQAA